MTPGFNGPFANEAMLMTHAAEVNAYLPPFVDMWVTWLLLIGLTSFFWAIRKTEARYIAAAYVLTIIVHFSLPLIIRPDNYVYATLSLIHAILWTPAVVAALSRWNQVEWRSFYGYWLMAALATMIISLVFDWPDAISYLRLIL